MWAGARLIAEVGADEGDASKTPVAEKTLGLLSEPCSPVP